MSGSYASVIIVEDVAELEIVNKINNKKEEIIMICPFLSIGDRGCFECQQEKCAWYVKKIGKDRTEVYDCAITALATYLTIIGKDGK